MTRDLARYQTYEGLKEILTQPHTRNYFGGGKVRNLVRNTKGYLMPDGTIEIRYYGTTIVTHYPDGTRRLYGAGISISTRLRIEHYTGVPLHTVRRQRNGWRSSYLVIPQFDKPIERKLWKCRECHGKTSVYAPCDFAGRYIRTAMAWIMHHMKQCNEERMEDAPQSELTLISLSGVMYCHNCKGTGKVEVGPAYEQVDYYDGIVLDADNNVV